MPAEFKIFQIENRKEQNRSKVQNALKRALRDFCPAPLIGWVPPYPREGENHLFFRTKEGILWARIFYEPLSHALWEGLDEEYETLMKGVKEKVTAYIFFPSMGRGIGEMLQSYSAREKGLLMNPAAGRFFEYCFLWSQEEEGLALKEWNLPPENPQASPQNSLNTSKEKVRTDYHFFKQARLSPPELEALLEIVHRLKKI